MQLFFSKKETLSRKISDTKANSPKIALYYKASMVGVTFLTLVSVGTFYPTKTAQASFLGDIIGGIIGSTTQAAGPSIELTEPSHNSQTVPLLESNLTPELKNTITDSSQGIVGEQAIEATEGIFGNSDVQKYATSEKISTYVVKKGDTIDGIAYRLKVSKDSVVYAADLKKGETLKPGQVLSIIPVNIPKVADKAEKSLENKVSTVKTPEKKAAPEKLTEKPKKIAVQAPTPTPEPVVESASEKEPDIIIDDSKEDATPVSKTEAGSSGRYIWPFPKGSGRISQGLHSDNAYDFAAPVGTPIYAVYDGSVLIARSTGYNGGYGLYVVVDFKDDRQAIFAHMSKIVVEVGDEVKKGDIIGYVGNTGKSTGPHLHLGFHGPKSNPYIGLKVNARDF